MFNNKQKVNAIEMDIDKEFCISFVHVFNPRFINCLRTIINIPVWSICIIHISKYIRPYNFFFTRITIPMNQKPQIREKQRICLGFKVEPF